MIPRMRSTSFPFVHDPGLCRYLFPVPQLMSWTRTLFVAEGRIQPAGFDELVAGVHTQHRQRLLLSEALKLSHSPIDYWLLSSIRMVAPKASSKHPV